jgi:hypothetical protein
VDALMNPTDETLMECNQVSERVLAAAGSELKEEILTRAIGMSKQIRILTYTYALSPKVVVEASEMLL